MNLFRRKNILRLFLQIVFVLISLELLLRVVFYQEFGLEKFALTESVKRVKNKLIPKEAGSLKNDNYLLARPDSSLTVNEQIFREVQESNAFEYQPWADYKNVNYAGKYINTNGNQRKTVPNEYINPASTLPPVVVRFFGGSTMYGFNSTDAETIPSAFVKLYAQKYHNGRSLKVINNGICAYHSYNELILFSHLTFSEPGTDIALFLDGLNDFYMVRAVMERLPYFYHRLELANSNQHISKKDILKTIDSRQTLFGIPEYLKGKNVKDSLLNRYLGNIQNIKKIGLTTNCRTFFFIQPNPFFNYPNKTNDPICSKEINTIVAEGYTQLEKYADTSKTIIFLGNMLEAVTGYPFIDNFHYSPVMSQKIAEQILYHVGPEINAKSF